MSDPHKKRSLVLADFDHPFFQSPVTKALCVLVPGVWAVVEFWSGAHFFGGLFGAAAAYLFWGCYIRKPGKE